MSQQAHEIERLLEEARLQMAWGIEVLHQQYCERVQQIYASMPVGGSGLSSSLMTQVGTGTVPVAGPSGCVPPAPRGQGTWPVPPAPREQGGSATRGVEFVRPVGRAPLRDCSNTSFQVVRRRRDGAPGPRPASAGRETGSRVSGASPSGSGVPRSRSHSRENVRPRASGPQGPRPQCRGSATGRLIQSGRLVQGRLVGGVALSKRSATTAIRRGTVLASVPSRGFCWGSAIPRCQGSSCSRAAAMLWGGEGCCSPRKGGNAGALSGFRPVRRGVGPHQGFVAGSVGMAGLEPSVVPGPSDVTLDTTQVLVPVVAGDLQLGAAVPEVGAPSSLGGLRLLWCRWSPPRVNRAPGRVLRPLLPVTTGSGGTRRGGPQLAGSSLLREELLPWRV